ncbi:MAG: phosphatase PAP2 family protein [Zetaproteobacteria bacterium]|nr:phosphatase PAP2 family protein [Zetaproteobacteria bacterium]
MSLETLDQIDQRLFIWLNHGPKFWLLDQCMLLLSSPWMWVGCIPLFSVLAYRYLNKTQTIHFVSATLITIALADSIAFRILKTSLQRLRPCYALTPDVQLLATSCGSEYGMPSNHAANSMAIAVIIWMAARTEHTSPLCRWFRLGALGVATLVGFSRIYLGVHYPGDVVAGFALGACLAWLTWNGQKKVLQRYHTHLAKP